MTRIKHKREVLQDEAIEGKETRVDGKGNQEQILRNSPDEKMGSWQTVKWRKKWMSSVDSFLKLRKKFSIYQYFSCWDRRIFDIEVLEVERKSARDDERPTNLFTVKAWRDSSRKSTRTSASAGNGSQAISFRRMFVSFPPQLKKELWFDNFPVVKGWSSTGEIYWLENKV